MNFDERSLLRLAKSRIRGGNDGSVNHWQCSCRAVKEFSKSSKSSNTVLPFPTEGPYQQCRYLPPTFLSIFDQVPGAHFGLSLTPDPAFDREIRTIW